MDRKNRAASDAAEGLFEKGWLEIDARIRRLAKDLEIAERKDLGRETMEAIGRQLLEIKKVVSMYEEKWIEFERRRSSLEHSLERRNGRD
ncbi:MAG: hypothetical protein R6U36_00885 [Candidatus Fermentibacteraceae bacterium]